MSSKHRPRRHPARQAARDHYQADAGILFGAPYRVDELQLAIVGLADDELTDRAGAVVDAIASRHQLSSDMRRVIFAKIISAMVVDLWAGYDPENPAAYDPDATLNAELDRLNLGLRHGLNARATPVMAGSAA